MSIDRHENAQTLCGAPCKNVHALRSMASRPSSDKSASKDDLKTIADEALLAATLEDSSETYTTMKAIKKALQGGDTVLIKGSWLKDQASAGSSLPRRQELPEEANAVCYENIDDENMLMDIIAFSYCWASPDHPDNEGMQLKAFIGPILEKLDRIWGELAAFIDWCSLYQAVRSQREEQAFARSLKSINLWYGHPKTLVVMVTVAPPYVKPYCERGWPLFEKTISGLLTPSHMLMDLSCPGTEETTCQLQPQELYDYRAAQLKRIEEGFLQNGEYYFPALAVRNVPMMHPSSFAEILAEKNFTNGSDATFVCKKYASTYYEMMSGASEFSLVGLDWSSEVFCALSKSFPYCKSLTTLDLTQNKISSLNPGVFVGLNLLKKLYLQDNEIAELALGTFDGLGALEKLYLNGNRLQQLHIGCFRGLSNLRVLLLSQVGIKEYPGGIYADLKMLDHLAIAFNSIQHIPSEALSILCNLKILNLRKNHISKVAAEFFDGLEALEILLLSHNQIEEIPSGAFSALTHLKELALGNNRNLKLIRGAFDGLTTLETLILSETDIEVLQPGAFECLGNLKQLELAHNKIMDLATGVFDNLCFLEVIDLDGNRIDTLPAGVLSSVIRLKELQLRGNPIEKRLGKGCFNSLKDFDNSFA